MTQMSCLFFFRSATDISFENQQDLCPTSFGVRFLWPHPREQQELADDLASSNAAFLEKQSVRSVLKARSCTCFVRIFRWLRLFPAQKKLEDAYKPTAAPPLKDLVVGSRVQICMFSLPQNQKANSGISFQLLLHVAVHKPWSGPEHLMLGKS